MPSGDECPTDSGLPPREYTDPSDTPEGPRAAVLRWIILGGLYLLAFTVRLFSVVRYESVIHEFDPHFNYRTTQQLTGNGWYEFYNWFDDTVWYPLGRAVGSTVYPGLMMTAGALHQLAHLLHFQIEIRNVCVFLAPVFAGNTAIATYGLAKEARGVPAGLVAAALVSIVPGYVSRSVAGSYDNEAIAIFAIVATFYTWVKAVKTGSLLWCFCNVIAYLYMVTAWGGYIFIVNIIPMYVLVMLAMGRYSHRLYIAYSVFYVAGTMCAMQVQFVGFKGILSGEHFPSAAVFVALQIHNFMRFVHSLLSSRDFRTFCKLAAIGALVVLTVGSMFGAVQPFTGRFYALLDPSYAEKSIIIASVSEHQPTPWSSFFFDLNVLVFLTPCGLFLCLRDMTDTSIFVFLYGIVAGYFGGVMVRLVLVFTPAACVLGGIAVSEALRVYCDEYYTAKEEAREAESAPRQDPNDGGESTLASLSRVSRLVSSSLVLVVLIVVFYVFVHHSVWVTSYSYSSPSIVLMRKGADGNRVMIDDYREAYRWLNQNTKPDAKVMSWWDYGYQLSSMANRTTIVDNNTWNNTHIATVGRALASSEEEAYKVIQKLDVDYILVVFGGKIGYSSDDINKFLWMVRISAGVYPEHIQEREYYTEQGQYRVDSTASRTMLSSLMYKLCYYDFWGLAPPEGKPEGFDRMRNSVIGRKDYKLTRFEEAFTTSNWLVRIYKVRPPYNRIGGP